MKFNGQKWLIYQQAQFVDESPDHTDEKAETIFKEPK
jgi:hypothetical protein